MLIRKAIPSDADAIMNIFLQAQARLRSQGVNQWQNGYPNIEIVDSDIASENVWSVWRMTGFVLYSYSHLNRRTPMNVFTAVNGKALDSQASYIEWPWRIHSKGGAWEVR